MAKNQNTYAKHSRELQKKRKAEEKRARRQRRKEQVDVPTAPAISSQEDAQP